MTNLENEFENKNNVEPEINKAETTSDAPTYNAPSYAAPTYKTDSETPVTNVPELTLEETPTYTAPQESTYQAPSYTAPQESTYQAPSYTAPQESTYQAPSYTAPQENNYQQPNNNYQETNYQETNYQGNYQQQNNYQQQQQAYNATPYNNIPAGYQAKSKLVAGLLGIFLGAFGVHNFYLGYTTKAVIQLVLTFVSCGISSVWGFIEGILILAGNIKVDGKGYNLID